MNFSELVPYQNAVYAHTGDMLAISKDRSIFVGFLMVVFLMTHVLFADL